MDQYRPTHSAYLSANLFGIILFSLYDGDPTSYSSSEMSESTKYSFVINWANAFVIQWLLIYVPYHWYTPHYPGPSASPICSAI